VSLPQQPSGLHKPDSHYPWCQQCWVWAYPCGFDGARLSRGVYSPGLSEVKMEISA
jgi:hypothetical protein